MKEVFLIYDIKFECLHNMASLKSFNISI